MSSPALWNGNGSTDRQERKMEEMEMRMLPFAQAVTRKNKIRNEVVSKAKKEKEKSLLAGANKLQSTVTNDIVISENLHYALFRIELF